MDISELLRQRKLTRAIAELFTRELNGHLQALAPLLNPRQVFGEYIHGNARPGSAAGGKAMEALRAYYEQVHATKPFNLRRQFDSPIVLLGATPQISTASYGYVAHGDDGTKDITVVQPLRWVLSFEGFGPARLRELLAGSGDTGTSLQQAVLHALLLAVTLEARPAVTDLLAALRFPVRIERHEAFGALPLAVISAPLSTARPSDDIIIASTEISGSSDFEEIVDGARLGDIADPLRDRLNAVVEAHAGK